MKIKISIPSELQYLKSIRKFVRDIISERQFKKVTVEQIVLAVDEACSNIIEHSYKMDPSKSLSITINCDEDKSTFVIEDNGIGLNSVKYKKLDLNKYIKKRREGGLGRYIIENVMDEVKYKRLKKKNRLSLVKYFDLNY
jgi:serine/threonine-protein kinase RsbW